MPDKILSFDDPAGDGQTVDRKPFLTCMRGKENDAAIIFLCGVIIISAGLSIGFTGISAEFQIREGHAHITVIFLYASAILVLSESCAGRSMAPSGNTIQRTASKTRYIIGEKSLLR